MRTITFDKIASTVEQLVIAAAHELPVDVIGSLEEAAIHESNEKPKNILRRLIENAKIAKEELIPLCQDTGVAVVFVELGAQVVIEPPANNPNATISDAINAGIAAGYEKGYLRKSIVAEPLHARKNTGTNTPAIIHYEFAGSHGRVAQPPSAVKNVAMLDNDKLKISIMLKGGGCENKSQFKMFKPTADVKEVSGWIVDVVKSAGADACPPFVVGVGLGGNFEMACLLSKRALLRPLTDHNADSFYADLEKDLLTKINKLNVGPQGLGGDTTALGVMIETAPCHIASLPVAVNIECHSHRHKSAVI
jgi:fumarate hydratase subunit alpha